MPPDRASVRAFAAFSIRTALVAVGHNKLRAALTSLGIFFGVASVIAMLAIGRGAQQEILEQMRLLGSNNVMVTPLVEQKEEPVTDQEPERKIEKFSPGLTREDAAAIAEVIPAVDAVSGEIVLNTDVTAVGIRRSAKVVGVDSTYFRLNNLEVVSGGGFTPLQTDDGAAVAIIGHGLRARFFTAQDPIGKPLKVGNVWLTVVGVLADRRLGPEIAARLGIRDPNMDVYVPLSTMLLRYRNRASITQRDIELAARARAGAPSQEEETTEQRQERTNRNQLDRIIVHVADTRLVSAVADVARRLLERRHNGVVDFEIAVPELLLKQEQRTRNIFNIVLGSIASISLVVGGIGIMNIMLASVLERIREIGVRRAVGARRREILFQFLSEAVLISVVGGIAGILAGAGLSSAIEHAAGIRTIVTYWSVVVAFGVSFSVGLAFGIVPAYRAAHQDPVVSLRYE